MKTVKHKKPLRILLSWFLALSVGLSSSMLYANTDTEMTQENEVEELAQMIAAETLEFGAAALDHAEELSQEAQAELDRWARESMIDDEVGLRLRKLYMTAIRDAMVLKLESNASLRQMGLMSELDSDWLDVSVNAVEFALIAGLMVVKVKKNIRFTRWMRTNRGAMGKEIKAQTKEMKRLAKEKLAWEKEKAKLVSKNQKLMTNINKIQMAAGKEAIEASSLINMSQRTFSTLADKAKKPATELKTNTDRIGALVKNIKSYEANALKAATADINAMSKRASRLKTAVSFSLRTLLRATFYSTIAVSVGVIGWDTLDSFRVALAPGAVRELPRFIEAYNDEIERIELRLSMIRQLQAVPTVEL